jgi:hypothetical protein
MEEKPAAPRVPTVVLLTTDAEELHGQLKAVCVQLLPEWKEIVRKTDDVQVECLSFSYEEMVFMVVGLKGVYYSIYRAHCSKCKINSTITLRIYPP